MFSCVNLAATTIEKWSKSESDIYWPGGINVVRITFKFSLNPWLHPLKTTRAIFSGQGGRVRKLSTMTGTKLSPGSACRPALPSRSGGGWRRNKRTLSGWPLISLKQRSLSHACLRRRKSCAHRERDASRNGGLGARTEGDKCALRGATMMERRGCKYKCINICFPVSFGVQMSPLRWL